MNRIRGLDAIRFVCAVWVMLSHYGIPLPFGHQVQGLVPQILYSTLHSAANGVAAVIIFFVISGFAIHYPFRHGEKPAWGEYFARRYIRIGLPFLAANALVHFSGGRLTSLQNAVLWSLYAEMIYYGIYPLLMVGRRQLGWTVLLALAFMGAAAVAFVQPHEFFNGHGTLLNWIIGLPSWLLGVRLAEDADILSVPKHSRLVFWRIGIWSVSVFCLALEFHSPISGSITMPFFSVLVFFWLRQEIGYYKTHLPLQWLEKAGTWSYSLYLMHHPAEWVTGMLVISTDPPVLVWIMKIVMALILSYIFYLLVERPSHLLARRVKRKLTLEVKPPELEGGPKESLSESGTGKVKLDVN